MNKTNISIISKNDSYYTFSDNGKEYQYPRVTHIIQEAKLIDFSNIPTGVLERAQNFGKAVHLMCLYDEQKRLNETILDPNLKPYLDSWRKFKVETSWTENCMLSEAFVFSHKYKFAGTIDRVYAAGLNDIILLDIKTGQINKTTTLQCASYSLALRESCDIIVDRLVIVELKPDYFKLHEITNSLAQAQDIFLACNTIYQFKHIKKQKEAKNGKE